VDGYTVIRPDEIEYTPPSSGRAGIELVRLSELLTQSRANIWRLAPGALGRRHVETVQEELFVGLEGVTTLHLGDPADDVALPAGGVAIVPVGTAIQLANTGDAPCVVLIVGAPPVTGAAEYLPDA
jgi:uncharacterized cupin superfamily protein